MRITAELLAQAEQRTNPLGERELVLQGLGIPAIENGAATRDAFDCWDLSNNRITRLDNFPKLLRISNLLCADNLVESLDAGNIASNLPNLQSLVLSHNKLSSLAQVAQIGKACPKLEFLTLNGNPVTTRQHYRLYTIHRIPSLKSLDYVRIKPAERDRARRLASSAAGAALESDVQSEKSMVKSFVPGEGVENQGGKSFVSANFTVEQKELIRNLLANASSVQEVEEIENAVRRGVLPKAASSTNNGGSGAGAGAVAS